MSRSSTTSTALKRSPSSSAAAAAAAAALILLALASLLQAAAASPLQTPLRQQPRPAAAASAAEGGDDARDPLLSAPGGLVGEPSQWDRVGAQDADFLLMNADEQALQRLQQQRRKRGGGEDEEVAAAAAAAGDYNLDDLKLVEALLNGWPIYVEAPSSNQGFERERRGGYGGYAAHRRRLTGLSKRGNKLLRLSLTNNIDVLREKLFMEIARRNRLLNESQVNQANSGLANIG